MKHVNYNDLTPSERREVRMRYIEEQNGKCLWCSRPLDWCPPMTVTDLEIDWSLFPPNFLAHPVHLQHCHKTGMTEGAVHAYCNAVMWQYHGR